MSAAAAVFRRELIEKRKSILFCLLFGVIPVIAPLISYLVDGSRPGAAQLRDILAMVLAITLFVTVAFLGGVTTIGRDLVEQRSSFYFSRPISPAALWTAKIAAAIVVAFACGIAVSLPAIVVARRLPFAGMAGINLGLNSILVAAIVAVPFFALAGHVLGISIRSKSAWLAFDVLALGATGFFVWSYLRILVLSSAEKLGLGLFSAFVIVVMGALAFAGFAQIAYGRTDIRAGHRAMSLALWLPILAFAGFVMLYLSWLGSGTPRDLKDPWVQRVSPRGDWMVLSGTRRFGADYVSSFLYSPVSGASEPIGTMSTTVFSGDGSTAAVLKFSVGIGEHLSAALSIAKLNRAPLRLEPTEIEFSGYPPALGLSRDGQRLATFDSHTITVLDLPTRRNLISANVSADSVSRAITFLFLGNDVVRCYAIGTQERGVIAPLHVFEVDLRTRKGRELAVIELTRGNEYRVSPDGAVILAGATIYDGTTGAVRRTLGTEERASSEFLSDGRIVISRAGSPSELAVFDPSGAPVRTIPIADAGVIRVCGEVSPGILMLGSRPGEFWLADVNAGTVRKVPVAGNPAVSRRWNQISDASATLAPGSLATRLVRSKDGSLLEIDPEAGGARVILQGSKR